jgi:hypothetical protein
VYKVTHGEETTGNLMQQAIVLVTVAANRPEIKDRPVLYQMVAVAVSGLRRVHSLIQSNSPVY